VIARIFDGVVIRHELELVFGIQVSSYLAYPELALSREDGRPRRNTETIDLIVVHNTVGDWPIRVRPGLAPAGDLAERNAVYWRRSPRQSGTHLVVDQDGTAICTADLDRVVAYGAGHPRGNGNGINVEMAALPDRETGGSVLYQGQIEATALLCDWLAVRFGIPRQAAAPRARGRELVKAIADPKGKVRGLADHCCFTRNRGIGDTGFLVQQVLAAKHGWTLVDWDAR